MKKTLAVLIWLALLLVLGLVCWGLALWNGWPLWGGVFLFLGAIALWFSGKLLWRLIKAWRERSQTAMPVEKPAAIVSAESALKDKWKEAVSLLRRSNLRRLGNPLYVLPWYMVVGRSGSGKTTALTRARLSSPLKKISPTATVETTVNVDWWYFDKAIVLDTAGRYIDPAEVEEDRREWNKMLDFLGHYRAKEGLNGLVLTIQADRLLAPDPDALAEEGRVIRMRIEQLIRLFDKRFPVYLLVTKCDQLYGMEAWSKLLPEGALDQAMGYVTFADAGLKAREDEVVDQAFAQIGDQLKRLQLAMMQRLGQADLGLLLFPGELSKLQTPLKAFLRHALGESPYLEEPFLRGVFFSSGLQQGGALSSLFDDVSLQEPAHAPSYKGMFLHDLFDRVLPGDRYLLRPAALVNPWRRATRHLGVTAWLTSCVAIAAYLSFSFVHGLNTLSHMREMYPEKLVLTGQLHKDVEALERFRSFAYWLEQRDSRLASRFLAYDSNVAQLEDKIKANYVAKFRKYILPGLDEAFARKVEELVRLGQSEQLADYIQTQVRRINLVQARLDNVSHENLRKMPPLSGSVLFEMDPNMSPDAASHFSEMYVALLAWQPNDLFRLQRLAALRSDLNRIALNSDDLTWIIDWADAQPDMKALRMADFWRGSRKVEGLPEIPIAFTSDGKARIDAFMAEVRKSAPNPASFDEKLARFNQWYAAEKQRRWRDFTWNFGQGKELLNGENEWRDVLTRLTTANSPYVLLSNRLVSEFRDTPVEAMPSWLLLNQRLFAIRQRAGQQALIQTPGVINDLGGRLMNDIASGGTVGKAKAELDAQYRAIGIYQTFAMALGKSVDETVASSGKAAQASASFHSFDIDPAGKSNLQDAYARLVELRRTLGSAASDDVVAWNILAGPLQLVVNYADLQASCVLQKAWDSKVVWPMQSASGLPEMFEQLYGDKGTVWAFISGDAKPYIRRGQDAYEVVETLGQSVPFTPDFLPFINAAVGRQVEQKVSKQQQQTAAQRAEAEAVRYQQTLQEQEKAASARLADVRKAAEVLRQTSYPVRLTGLPTGVNDGAKANVLGTLLTVHCASVPFSLNNLNFAVTDAFNWSQQTCGETVLKIRMPAFTLSKTYPGSNGFVAFLQDFKTGTRSFAADDFPLDKARLEALNLKQITVRYKFSGEALLLQNAGQLHLLENEAEKAQQQQQDAKLALAALSQQSFQGKMQSGTQGDPPMTIKVPGRIGQCWGPQVSSGRQEKSPRKLIEELVAARVAASDVAAAQLVLPRTATGRLQTGSVEPSMVQLLDGYQRAESWIAKDGRYTLQLLLSDDQKSAEQTLKQLGGELGMGKLQAYPTRASGTAVIAIAYGDFASSGEAVRAIAALPEQLKSHRPMVRSSQGIRNELRGLDLYR